MHIYIYFNLYVKSMSIETEGLQSYIITTEGLERPRHYTMLVNHDGWAIQPPFVSVHCIREVYCSLLYIS